MKSKLFFIVWFLVIICITLINCDNKKSLADMSIQELLNKVYEGYADDTEKEEVEGINFPFEIRPRTHALPYDDSVFTQIVRDYLVYKGGAVGSMRFGEYYDLETSKYLGSEKEDVKGTNFNPEGPPIFSQYYLSENQLEEKYWEEDD